MITKNKHILYIDILRIIACFFVIVNHTSKFYLYDYNFFISKCYFFIAKVAVPIFLMISGVTLLQKKYTYKEIFIKVIQIVLILFIFSIIYYLFYNNYDFNIFKIILNIYKGSITNAFWYLYLYITILLSLPFIKMLTDNMKQKDYLYYFMITFIFLSLYKIIIHYDTRFIFTGHLDFSMFNWAIGCMLLGKYINDYLKIDKNKFIISILLFIIFTILNILFTYNEYLLTPTKFLFFDNCRLITIILPSACLFIIIKYIDSKINYSLLISKIIKYIGKSTFGIYLISDLVIFLFSFKIYNILMNIFNPCISILLMQVSIFTIGFVITIILKKIPYINKVI